jgi:hypothetical protein
MTSLLERALQETQRLPESKQDRIARLILDKIEDEARWQSRFEKSQDQLAASPTPRARRSRGRS